MIFRNIFLLILMNFAGINSFRIANVKTNRYIDSSNFGDVFLNFDEFGPWSNWIPIKVNQQNDEWIYLKNQATGHFLLGFIDINKNEGFLRSSEKSDSENNIWIIKGLKIIHKASNKCLEAGNTNEERKRIYIRICTDNQLQKWDAIN